MDQKYIYVAISATPTFTGRMIRALTRSHYNHIAISFEPDFSIWYSFARRYRNTPFCGGFVSESPRRYVQDGRVAAVRIYRIPVSAEEYIRTLAKCRRFAKLGEKSIYNNISAVTSLWRTKFEIKNAYTCVEFAVEMLCDLYAASHIDRNKWYSIESLRSELERFLVYKGRFPVGSAEWGDDKFNRKLTFGEIVKEEVSSNGRLIMNAVSRRD